MTKQPEPWVESMLVAYVDDQLDPAQRAAVEDILRDDPHARAVVGVLRRSAAAVRNAFDRPLHEQAPARLLAALGAGGAPAAAGNVVAMRRPPARARPSRAGRTAIAPFAALAASIAMLLIGIGAGYLQFAPQKSIRPAGTEASAFEITLYRALERDEPGARIGYDDEALGRSGGVTLTGTVETSLGGACREFRHDWQGKGGPGTERGIACRSAAGEWSVLTVPQEPAS